MAETDQTRTQAPPPALPVVTGDFRPADSAAALVDVLDQYLADLQAGRAPDRSALLAGQPELAAQLEQCLAGIEFIHQAAKPAGDAITRLDDFRIVREIGRGGMGVVYEAEQVSLKRKVALKVLRFGGGMEPETMQRFQREAETVARLHHTNIVPIFAVGCAEGVHYYAMQFIKGQSLADVLKGSPKHPRPLDATAVTEWGRQAAEALAHAHQRGVIHRDIKPSNLLLDSEGVLWLTDFGLAKRADEATMTVAGALLGTPRYMSPEQAAGRGQPVDHRSDVYSLGASLYELATDQPAFNAETPQQVIAQILDSEPAPPRQLRPNLPLDLETILLKCLAKEPTRRYASAQELADDLRRFQAGEPILARRPSLLERVRRGFKKQRNHVLVAGLAAAAAVLLVLGGIFAFARLEAWQQGKLFLTTEGPVLTGELLTDKGDLAVPRFTVPTEEPLAVPAGSYRLRLHGRGLLDETYLVEVERGQEATYEVSLNDQRFGDPIQVPRSYELAAMEGRTDVILLSDSGVSRVNAATGQAVWTTKLNAEDEPLLTGFRWDWGCLGNIPGGRDAYDHRPHLVQRLADLNSDGIPDLVFTSQRQAGLLALSGKDGKVLWCFRAPDSNKPLDGRFYGDYASQGTIIGKPAMVDVDGDGTPDLLITCAAAPCQDGTLPRWVEAVSGLTGKSLWRYDLDERWFTAPASGEVPYDSRWFGEGGMSVGGISRFGGDELFTSNVTRSLGGSPASYAAEVTQVAGRFLAVVAAGTHLVCLELANGKPAWPALNLGSWPLRAPQHADLDGDGDGDILFLRPTLPEENSGIVADDCLTLVAITLRTRQILWQANFRSRWQWNWYEQPAEWPLVADIDGDGRPEIIVPTGGETEWGKWSGVELLDGATGIVRWQRLLSRRPRLHGSGLERVNRFLVGPDLNGDGYREVFTAVIEPTFKEDSDRIMRPHLDLAVDALSGKDGHSLWWSRPPIQASFTNLYDGTIEPLRWWGAGPDGWPQLLVPFLPGTPQDPRPPKIFFLSGGTGRLQHTLADFNGGQVADLDGDHLPDLIGFRPKQPGSFDGGGKLEILRGRSPEAWRRLGGVWRPTVDLDSDGIPDLLFNNQDVVQAQDVIRQRAGLSRQSGTKTQTMAASGLDGHILWQSNADVIRTGIPSETSLNHTPPLGMDTRLSPHSVTELDHTLYARDPATQQIAAILPSKGTPLWTANIPSDKNWEGPYLLVTHHLDAWPAPQTLLAFGVTDSFDPQAKNVPGYQYYVAVLEADTGRLRWQKPLGEKQPLNPPHQVNDAPFAYLLADLDGDGVMDEIIEDRDPAADGGLHAFSGRDGSLLWRWAPAPRQLNNGNFRASRPTLRLLDWDHSGKPDIVVLHQTTKADQAGRLLPHAEVVLLDGATGSQRWSWQEPVDSSFNQPSSQRVHSMEVPLLVKIKNGREPAICVWTSSYQAKDQIFLLDANGQVIQRRAPRFRLNEEDRIRQLKDPRIHYSSSAYAHFQVWSYDLDGDGADELVFLAEDKLVVTHEGLKQVLWEWPLPPGECDVIGFLPAQAVRPATLVVQAGNAIHGFAGPSGKPLWACIGPGTLRAMLSASDQGALPSFVFDLGKETTVCRRALPIELGLDSSGAALPLFFESTEADPRLACLLPWNLPLGDQEVPYLLATPFRVTLILIGIALGCIIVPVALLRGFIYRRQWTLGFLAFLWLDLFWAATYGLYFLSWGQEADRQLLLHGRLTLARNVLIALLALAIVGMPLIAFLRQALVLIQRKRWKQFAGLLSASCLLSGAIAWIILRYLADQPFPDQRYSWEGWYAIWPAGVYALGMLILGWKLLRGGIRLAGWLFVRLGRRIQPA
jgi:outer membrane protein assembly factor BamB